MVQPCNLTFLFDKSSSPFFEYITYTSICNNLLCFRFEKAIKVWKKGCFKLESNHFELCIIFPVTNSCFLGCLLDVTTNSELPVSSILRSKKVKQISRSRHRTTNFPNSRYFVCLLFYWFFYETNFFEARLERVMDGAAGCWSYFWSSK